MDKHITQAEIRKRTGIMPREQRRIYHSCTAKGHPVIGDALGMYRSVRPDTRLKVAEKLSQQLNEYVETMTKTIEALIGNADPEPLTEEESYLYNLLPMEEDEDDFSLADFEPIDIESILGGCR